jgi:putative transposase
VLDLAETGRSVADVARDLEISDQSIYTWRRQDRIDRGLQPGLTSGEKAEVAAAKRRIAGLETELRAMRRRWSWCERWCPKRRFEAVKVMAADGIPVQVACRVLDVSTLGLYAWWSRPPSARAIRHVWLTDLIVEVHQRARGTYGACRVHAELRLGRGIVVGHGAVAMLIRRARLAGPPAGPNGVIPSPIRSPPTWSTVSSPAAGRTSCG